MFPVGIALSFSDRCHTISHHATLTSPRQFDAAPREVRLRTASPDSFSRKDVGIEKAIMPRATHSASSRSNLKASGEPTDGTSEPLYSTASKPMPFQFLRPALYGDVTFVSIQSSNEVEGPQPRTEAPNSEASFTHTATPDDQLRDIRPTCLRLLSYVTRYFQAATASGRSENVSGARYWAHVG